MTHPGYLYAQAHPVSFYYVLPWWGISGVYVLLWMVGTCGLAEIQD